MNIKSILRNIITRYYIYIYLLSKFLRYERNMYQTSVYNSHRGLRNKTARKEVLVKI